MSSFEVVLLGSSNDPVGPSVERLAAVGLDATVRQGRCSGEADAVLAVAADPVNEDAVAHLVAVATSGTPVLFAWADAPALRSAVQEHAGVVAGELTARHEVRIRASAAFGLRAQPDVLVRDRLLTADKWTDDVSVLATANLGLADHPVLTWRESTGVGVLGVGTEPSTWDDHAFLQLVHRWVHLATRRPDRPAVRVGLLGYGAIGHEHNRAVQAVPGLLLTAVCDRDPARVELARQLAPDVEQFADASDLLDDGSVDLVVVSTPPNTHADWALRALGAGKHVVLEKPMALTTADCDAVMDRAREVDRSVVVYQNRRWDPDFLALQQLVDRGALGEVFHLEAFVGRFEHPCNYWHSDAGISGGAVFDWGSHFLDQVLMLNRAEVRTVTATEHKRVWHDVTNADHSRVTLHFTDGTEATFINSDLAAALKPKWYVLGTAGAAVADWRHERLVTRSEIGTVAEQRFAPADAPADVFWHAPDGSVTSVALPDPPAQPFHHELADFLLEGLPMSVRAEQSRRVVAVMEAAAESARGEGRPVVPA